MQEFMCVCACLSMCVCTRTVQEGSDFLIRSHNSRINISKVNFALITDNGLSTRRLSWKLFDGHFSRLLQQRLRLFKIHCFVDEKVLSYNIVQEKIECLLLTYLAVRELEALVHPRTSNKRILGNGHLYVTIHRRIKKPTWAQMRPSCLLSWGF